MTHTPTAAPAVKLVPLTELRSSKSNPRKAFDKAYLSELAASIREKGVLQPLLVRPVKAGMEIVAGECRFRAAKEAGLESVPALVRELSDLEVLEVQVIENLQRRDLHPLEEAEGYRQLVAAGYDVARIAEKIGLSVKYVYDRLKLNALVKEARELFLAGTISAGHAILLARLKPKDQQRAIGTKENDHIDGGLLVDERTLWDPEGDEAGARPSVKAVSVRELEAWIAENVRFREEDADPMLFPETAATLMSAKEEAEKIIPITHEPQVHPDAKDGDTRTYGPRSWTRADGKNGSKVCDHAVTGVIVVGPGRGEAFRVCAEKKKCKTHWAAEQREAKRRAAGGSQTRSAAVARWEQEDAKRRAEQQREQAEQQRWKEASAAVLEAVAAAVKKAKVTASGPVASVVLRQVDQDYGRGQRPAAEKLLGAVKSVEDVLRLAALIVLLREAQEWGAFRHFPKIARAFGVDARKIVDEVAPAPAPDVQTSGKPEASPKKAGKGGR